MLATHPWTASERALMSQIEAELDVGANVAAFTRAADFVVSVAAHEDRAQSLSVPANRMAIARVTSNWKARSYKR
jgi:hypothetical protein